MQASSTTWAHAMTIQKLELYVHVVDVQNFVCCRRPTAQTYCPSRLVMTCTADPYYVHNGLLDHNGMR